MKPLLLVFPGNETVGEALAMALQAETASVRVHRFPSGESLVTLPSNVSRRQILLICSLNGPDPKTLPLLFAADCARDLGAASVGLVAPYLAYLRQDRRFHEGEAITSRTFAALLSRHFDFIFTVDPHLHRYTSLAEIYDIPATAVSAAQPLSDWIRREVQMPLLIGPDQESEQWVRAVAGLIDAPYTVLTKIRHDDYHVEVSLPEASRWRDRTPVLLDDIIETAQTMIAATKSLKDSGLEPPVCLGVHALFAGSAYDDLQSVGAARIVSCDSVTHTSNGITVVPVIAAALRSFLDCFAGE